MKNKSVLPVELRKKRYDLKKALKEEREQLTKRLNKIGVICQWEKEVSKIDLGYILQESDVISFLSEVKKELLNVFNVVVNTKWYSKKQTEEYYKKRMEEVLE